MRPDNENRPIIHSDVKEGDLFRDKDGEIRRVVCEWSGYWGETHRVVFHNPDGTLWLSLSGNGCNIATNISHNDGLERINRPYHMEKYRPDCWEEDAERIVFDYPEEGDFCNVLGCGGRLEWAPDGECLCFLHPPCQACEDAKLTCNKCGKVHEVEDE